MSSFKEPVFLFSLPRSGSTLLQRILMCHSSIGSAAEPWILLPLLYAQKTSGIFTEYNQSLGSQAVADFIDQMPGAKETYQEELGKFIQQLYSNYCQNGEIYFLDKTPRYYFIIDQIAEIFPNAKFIFLFRNPMAILGSVLSTWCNQSLKKIHLYHSDLNQGPFLLNSAFIKLEDRSSKVYYEDLVRFPEEELRKICDYLEIPFQSSMMEEFSKVKLQGKMGDRKGIQDYHNLSDFSLGKYTEYFRNPVHRAYFRSYISGLDNNILASIGYDQSDLLKQINSQKTWRLGSLKEWFFWFRGYLILRLRLNLFFFRKEKSGKWKYYS